MKNFFYGLIALSRDVKVFVVSLIHNQSLLGFFGGLFAATLISGFILTKNPRHLPLVLRYSVTDSFQKISKRDKNGTFKMAFSKFIKVYTQVRIIFLISFISFCVMITTLILSGNMQ